MLESPPEVEGWMDNNTIPILKLVEPLKLVELKHEIVPRLLNFDPTSDNMHAYLQMGVYVHMVNFHIFNSICVGASCDGLDTENANQCACFKNPDTSNSKFLTHLQLKVVPHVLTTEYGVKQFTSKKFTALCLTTNNIPLGLTVSSFDRREKIVLRKCIANILEYVNINSGWTVQGWVKRGLVSAQAQQKDANIRNPNKIDSSTLTYHITSLTPTKTTVNFNNFRYNAVRLLHNEDGQNATATARDQDRASGAVDTRIVTADNGENDN